MKKSVLFLIGVICAISIFVIAFFGSKANFDQFKVYIKSVEITNFDQQVKNKKYLFLEYDELEGASVFINYKISPTNASDPSAITFVLTGDKYTDDDGNEVVKAEIDAKGELFFYRRGTVTVKVLTTDGLKASDSVTVICR